MKTATTQVVNFLNANRKFGVADLYTFTVKRQSWVDGTGLVQTTQSYYFTSWDTDIVYSGITYKSTVIIRDRIKSVIGVEVDKLNIEISDLTNQVESLSIPQACVRGVFDGATIKMDRAIIDTSIVGLVNMFNGRVSQVNPTRSGAKFEVASDLELLNINMPKRLYQSGCQNSLYDTACGLSRNSFSAQDQVVIAISTTNITGSIATADGYWDLGVIVFKTGQNAGLVRTVKHWDRSTANIQLTNPLPFIPASGDIFRLYAGCDKTKDTCSSKFNNLLNFKGFPYVPSPETMR